MDEAELPRLPGLQEIKAKYPPLPEVLAQYSSYLVGRVYQLVSEHFAQLLAGDSLSSRELTILALVGQDGPMVQIEIARRLRMDKNTVVTTLNSLSAQGLIQRCPSAADGRAFEIQLTDSGRSIRQWGLEMCSQVDNDLTAALSPDEKDQLMKLLRKIIE